MSFTKNITIQANGLQGPSGLNEIYIVLGFNQDAIKTAQTPFSGVAWKVAPLYLHKLGHQYIDVTYIANLGVCMAQVDVGQVVNLKPGIDTPISVGQQVDLENNDDPQFTNPTSYINPQGFAVNDKISDRTVTIGAGLYDDNGNFSTISVWQDISNTACVDVQFTPKISIFASAHYVQSQLLPGHISSLLWNHDLADVNLPESLVFDLSWSASSSKFVLTLKA